ncbi:hypothetical protein AGDE_13541 [Angomonas deanei]|nr:hypothetical protein AGDE_13541 [Angomonas deanei]|eukprot:EPY22198.1 hypothetical protein AGDE_13541 [Angomonas deanei]
MKPKTRNPTYTRNPRVNPPQPAFFFSSPAEFQKPSAAVSCTAAKQVSRSTTKRETSEMADRHTVLANTPSATRNGTTSSDPAGRDEEVSME